MLRSQYACDSIPAFFSGQLLAKRVNPPDVWFCDALLKMEALVHFGKVRHICPDSTGDGAWTFFSLRAPLMTSCGLRHMPLTVPICSSAVRATTSPRRFCQGPAHTFSAEIGRALAALTRARSRIRNR